MDPLDIIHNGILLSFVPEDRFGMGLVGTMNIINNIKLRTYRDNPGIFADQRKSTALAAKIVEDLEVVTPDINRTPIRRLSGGNVQKVLVGREIASNPTVLMTAYAVRGLDINTSYTIYNLLTEQKMKGVAVIYVGEDLDVLLELCDPHSGALRRSGQRHCGRGLHNQGGDRSADDPVRREEEK